MGERDQAEGEPLSMLGGVGPWARGCSRWSVAEGD